jgi:hypothetical protein
MHLAFPMWIATLILSSKFRQAIAFGIPNLCPLKSAMKLTTLMASSWTEPAEEKMRGEKSIPAFVLYSSGGY